MSTIMMTQKKHSVHSGRFSTFAVALPLSRTSSDSLIGQMHDSSNHFCSSSPRKVSTTTSNDEKEDDILSPSYHDNVPQRKIHEEEKEDDSLTMRLNKCLAENSPHQAERLLVDLKESQKGDTDPSKQREEQEERRVTIRESHYRQVLQGWHDLQPPSAKRAQQWLDYMIVQYQNSNNRRTNVFVSVKSCNLVLATWVLVEKAEGAQALLDRMLELVQQYQHQQEASSEHQDSITRTASIVNVQSFELVLEAWSRSKSTKSGSKAQALLQGMMALSSATESSNQLEPSTLCYLRVMECCVNSFRKGRSEQSIRELQEWYKIIVDAYSDNPEEVNPQYPLDALLLLLRAYSKLSNAHRSEELLLEFTETFRNHPNVIPVPIDLCLIVLSTWSQSKSGRRASRAEQFLAIMEKDNALPNPTVACYTAVLHAWATSDKPKAARRAELLLRSMEGDDSRNGSNVTPPNLKSYTCVLVALSRSNDPKAPEHAERLFQEMMTKDISPDRVVFAMLITTWGRSTCPTSIEKAMHYWEELTRRYSEATDNHDKQDPAMMLKPTTVEYTALIQAWANYAGQNVENSKRAFESVETLLQEMIESTDPDQAPNHLTFAAILRTLIAARRLPDRGARATKILHKMRRCKIHLTPQLESLASKCFPRQKDATSREES